MLRSKSRIFKDCPSDTWQGLWAPSLPCLKAAALPHREVELLRLLLVGSPLGDAGLAHEGFRDRGLDRLHRVAVLEAVRHIKIFNGHNVLDGLQGGLHCFLYLPQQGPTQCMRGSLRNSRWRRSLEKRERSELRKEGGCCQRAQLCLPWDGAKWVINNTWTLL